MNFCVIKLYDLNNQLLFYFILSRHILVSAILLSCYPLYYSAAYSIYLFLKLFVTAGIEPGVYLLEETSSGRNRPVVGCTYRCDPVLSGIG
jgi:hypothetical protein